MSEDKVTEALRFEVGARVVRRAGIARSPTPSWEISSRTTPSCRRSTPRCSRSCQRTSPTLLEALDERERRIISLRFGLDRGEPRTLEEVGKHFNLTRERIRQIEARAMAKLRHPAHDATVSSLLGV